jgi:ketosteroid isomerase-like protein
LIVDGGVVTNADISMSSGGKITLKNGGNIVVQTGKDFNVPTNALLDMTNGKILRSNDF